MPFVELEQKGHVGLITINRPEVLNALNLQVLKELDTMLDEVEGNKDIYVLVITGAGRAFVAGADIGEMAHYSAAEAKSFSRHGNSIMLRLTRFPRPVIAAVNGYALGGGCELAMSCDIRIGSDKAKFGMPEVGLGITPGFGGTQRMARLIGMGRAKELLYTARKVKAPEALAIGLVQGVYPVEQLMEETLKMAARIAGNAPIAVRATKKAVNDGLQVDMDRAIEIEEQLFGSCFETEDQKNAMGAFLEKRKPDPFVNR